jgi:uncharacterized protein YyaL (SSP411 family)
MIDVLISLSTLLEDEKYVHFAFKTLEYNSYELSRKPVIYPYMFRQTLRYLKGDRVIKSTLNNLLKNSLNISLLQYPFILKKLDNNEDFLVCGNKSCFANTKNIKDLDNLIEKTF